MTEIYLHFVPGGLLTGDVVLIGLERSHIRLTDFGLAKEGASTSLRDTACGTPLYMAPESIRSMQSGNGGARTPPVGAGRADTFSVDWWTFGTLIYEMVTGKTPFTGKGFEELMKHIARDELGFPASPELSPPCKSLIAALLEKTEASRLGSVDSTAVKRHEWFRTAIDGSGPDFMQTEEHWERLLCAALPTLPSLF